jgi:hypothetical protein
MGLEIYVDIDDVMDELDRIKHPNFLAYSLLETELAQAYATTQSAVHIITGSLKNSGNTATSMGGDEWTGEISYGGLSPGAINDPVKYAFYEWRRGGMHNFFIGIDNHATDEKFIAAIINGHFRDTTGHS